MSPHTGPDLDALRDLGATLGERTPADDARAREDARAALLTAIGHRAAGASPFETARNRRPRRLRHARSVLALAAAASIAVAVVPGSPLRESDPSATPTFWNAVVDVTQPPSAAAAPALERAADAAEAQTQLPFTDGTVWVTKTRESELIVDRRGFASVQPTTVELTTTTNGRVHMHTEKAGPFQLMNRASVGAWRAAGSPEVGGGGYDGALEYEKGPDGAPYAFGGRFFTYSSLLALPRDPVALGRELREAVAAGPTEVSAWSQLNAITDLMERAPLPPDLRAAFWRVAAAIPGLKLAGTQSDRLGRTGTAIIARIGHEWRQVVFDPSTGALLASRIVNLRTTTTCDRDLAPCDRAKTPTDKTGQPWKVIAPAGSVEYEKLYLSMEVVPSRR